jgi:hypothetical protein
MTETVKLISRASSDPESATYLSPDIGSGLTSKELGVRLKRDASMISKVYSTYTEQRDLGPEGRILVC